MKPRKYFSFKYWAKKFFAGRPAEEEVHEYVCVGDGGFVIGGKAYCVGPPKPTKGSGRKLKFYGPLVTPRPQVWNCVGDGGFIAGGSALSYFIPVIFPIKPAPPPPEPQPKIRPLKPVPRPAAVVEQLPSFLFASKYGPLAAYVPEVFLYGQEARENDRVWWNWHETLTRNIDLLVGIIRRMFREQQRAIEIALRQRRIVLTGSSVELSAADITAQIDPLLKASQQKYVGNITTVLNTTAESFGRQVSAMMSFAWPGFTGAVSTFMKAHVPKLVDHLNQTSMTKVRSVIRTGIEKGWDVDKIAVNVHDAFDGWQRSRPYTIARTEVGIIASLAQQDTISKLPINNKDIDMMWLTARDTRVRDTHVALEGQVQPFGTPFSNGLRFPRDPEGPAVEICNCRCTLKPILKKPPQLIFQVPPSLQQIQEVAKPSTIPTSGALSWTQIVPTGKPMLHGVPFEPVKAGWWKGVPDTIKESKLPELPPSFHQSAGCVIVESDGRVWVVEPKGHFGGYEHTFPKGGVSKGLTLQQTAMKEVWEESGLKVEILDTIGDFKGTTSTTRYYLAKRTGGAPWMFGEETATVNLASLDDVEKLLNVQRDKDILAVAKKKLLEKKMISVPVTIPPLTKPLIPVVAPLPPSLQGPIGLDGTPTLLVDGLKQVGGQAGSNVGGLFEASDGSRYYVKLTKSAAHAQNEVLTARLYQEAGIDVPEIRHASWNGKDAVASKIVKVDKAAGADVLSKLTGTWEGFATDAWVANWDVVGMTYDNLVVSGGKALRLDTGGGLLYRAQGVSKGVKFGNVADEIHTLRNASYNSKAASVFGSMTDAQVIKSIDRVLKIEDSQIRDIVKKYGVGSANDRVTLAEKLVARKNFLRDYRNTLAKKNGLGIWKPSTPGVVPSTPGPAVPIVPTTGPAAISPAVAAKTEADLWKEIAPIQKALYNKTALAPELVKKMEQQLADLKLQVKKVHLEGQINYLQKQIKGYEVVGTKTHGAKVKVGMLKSTLAKLQKDLAVFEKPIGVPPAAPTSPIILPQQKLTQGQMKKVNAFQKDIEDLLNNPDLQNVWGLELGSFYKIHEALLKSIATLSTQMDWKATVGQINKLETSYKIKKGFLLKKIQKAKTLPTLLPHITIPPKPLAMPQSSYDTAVAQLKLLEKDLSKSGLTLGEKGNFKNATKLWLDIIKKWETATAPTTVPSPKLPGVPAFIKGKTLVYVLKNQSALETYLDTEGARKTEAVVKFIDNWKHTYYRTYREYQKNPAAWRVSMGQNYTAAEIRQVESILKKEIEAMEAMYDILPSVESKPGETIWRGVRVAARPDAQKAYAKIRPVGSEITLKAFSSATRDSSVTASFISTDAPIIYEYRNFHKGGLYLGKYGLAGEREVLMKKGLKFRVVGHEMRRYDIFNKPVLVIIVEQI